MSRITATWNPQRATETKVRYLSGFDEMDKVTKLDFLQDFIGELTDKYNATLDEVKNGRLQSKV